MSNQGKRMVNENLIAILKELDSKGISIADLADVLDAFASGEVQEKLTAGDNISISEENVISATDTTYTAGDNVTITDGVISASGGDVWESEILVDIPNVGEYWTRLHTKEQITASNVTSIVRSELVDGILPLYLRRNQASGTGIQVAWYIQSNIIYLTGITIDNGVVVQDSRSLGGNMPDLAVWHSHKIN